MSAGDIIKKLRIEKGYTQSELAIMLGLKLSTLQKYESGMIVNIKLETLRELCSIFDVPPITLVFPNLTTKEKQGLLKWGIMEYSGLNEAGYKKAIEYIADLKKIESYRKIQQ